MMLRKLSRAAPLNSLSLSLSRTGNATPSTQIVSTLPAGRSTPSMSRKTTLDLSSGGSFGRSFFAALALAAASRSGSGGGRKSYNPPKESSGGGAGRGRFRFVDSDDISAVGAAAVAAAAAAAPARTAGASARVRAHSPQAGQS